MTSTIEKVEARLDQDARNWDKAVPDVLISRGEFHSALAEAWEMGKEDLARALLPDAEPPHNPWHTRARRPLAVIDPAEVDVRHLADAYERAMTEKNSRVIAMKAALSELGLVVP